ncbi:protein O-mannosyl-transferase TMTC3 [Trichonephila clavipes]|nr:protein O-mannosyl-transferase TMTC3 [Trichonephila clavipes]
MKTITRNFDWKNEETLFRSGLRITKNNAKLYNNLGHVMEAEGKNDDALKLFLKAAEIQPDDLGSHLNVGRMYNILGMTEKAEKAFWMAKNLLPKVRPGKPYQTHIVPRHLDLFLNLGNLLSRNHSRLEEAQQASFWNTRNESCQSLRQIELLHDRWRYHHLHNVGYIGREIFSCTQLTHGFCCVCSQNFRTDRLNEHVLRVCSEGIWWDWALNPDPPVRSPML